MRRETQPWRTSYYKKEEFVRRFLAWRSANQGCCGCHQEGKRLALKANVSLGAMARRGYSFEAIKTAIREGLTKGSLLCSSCRSRRGRPAVVVASSSSSPTPGGKKKQEERPLSGNGETWKENYLISGLLAGKRFDELFDVLWPEGHERREEAKIVYEGLREYEKKTEEGA